MSGYPEHYDAFDIARFEFVLARLPKTGTVLDVGCGDGMLTRKMREHGLTVLGLDAEPNDGVRCNCAEMSFDDGEFDYVTAFEILEHLEDRDLKPAVENMKRIAKEKVFVSVPVGHNVFHNTHKRFFDKEMLLALFPGAEVSVMPVGHPRVLWFWVVWNAEA